MKKFEIFLIKTDYSKILACSLDDGTKTQARQLAYKYYVEASTNPQSDIRQIEIYENDDFYMGWSSSGFDTIYAYNYNQQKTREAEEERRMKREAKKYGKI